MSETPSTATASGSQRADGPQSLGLTTAASLALQGSIEPTLRAEHIATRLAQAIQVGIIAPGEKLPSELQLADELGTAPVTLREALATLRARGLVETRRGRGGGTFVRSDGTHRPIRDTHLRQRLLDFSHHDLRELGDYRRAVSAMAAALAADRALPPEIETLQLLLKRFEEATGMSERRRADTLLTVEVASTAQSATLTRKELSLLNRLGDLTWWRRDDSEHVAAIAMRRRMITAIGDGDRQVAADAAEQSVVASTTRLLALRLELSR